MEQSTQHDLPNRLPGFRLSSIIVVCMFIGCQVCCAGCGNPTPVQPVRDPRPEPKPTTWFDNGDFGKVVTRLSEFLRGQREIIKGGNHLAIKENEEAITRALKQAEGQTVHWSLPVETITTTYIQLQEHSSEGWDDFYCHLNVTGEGKYSRVKFFIDKDVPKQEFLKYREKDRFWFTGRIQTVEFGSHLTPGYYINVYLVDIKHKGHP